MIRREVDKLNGMWALCLSKKELSELVGQFRLDGRESGPSVSNKDQEQVDHCDVEEDLFTLGFM